MFFTRNFWNASLLIFFSFAIGGSVHADYNPPGQAPPGGNVDSPVYSVGAGQTLTGTLSVTASSGTALQGSGGSIGLQGGGSTTGAYGTVSGTALNGVFGEVQTGGSGGGRGVYALAVDADDYAAYLSGGLGLGLASGDVWFIQRGSGIAWPRVSDGAYLYGLYVADGTTYPDGQLQIRGHGGGIAFMAEDLSSVGSISETGNLTVANDLYATNNKSIHVDSGSADTTVLIGNYGDGKGFCYDGDTVAPCNGTTYSANLAVEGNVKGNGICIQDDCKTTWSAVASNLWTQSGSNIYPNNTSWSVAIGSTDPGAYKLHVTGDFYATGNVLAGGGADIAEQFKTASGIKPGTVMVMGEDGYDSAVPSSKPYDRTVIGVVSEKAAVIMRNIEGSDKSVIALAGSVPVKVTNEGGTIKKGDLLTTSSTPGHAMKAVDPISGTIIGKAFESFVGTEGTIYALINAQ